MHKIFFMDTSLQIHALWNLHEIIFMDDFMGILHIHAYFMGKIPSSVCDPPMRLLHILLLIKLSLNLNRIKITIF